MNCQPLDDVLEIIRLEQQASRLKRIAVRLDRRIPTWLGWRRELELGISLMDAAIFNLNLELRGKWYDAQRGAVSRG